VSIVDFGFYSLNNPADLNEWMKISRTLSAHLQLEPRTLLVDAAEYTLVRSNGVYGLFEDWLWNCKSRAKARKCKITWALLRECSPPAKKVEAIKQDHKLGAEFLAAMPPTPEELNPKRAVTETEAPKAKSRKPFERKPDRDAMLTIEMLDED
jgi:hypothetical protein